MRESVKRHSKLFIGKKMKLDLQNVDMDVRTDSKWLGFILDQILSNALKYTKKWWRSKKFGVIQKHRVRKFCT